MRDLVILGAGGFGREVAQVVADVNAEAPTWNLLGFVDGDASLAGSEIAGLPVLGDLTWCWDHPGAAVAVGIGGTRAKRAVLAQLDARPHGPLATLVHPRAWVGSRVEIGEGTAILAGASISVDIRIGRAVCINKNAIIGHDAVLEDHVTVAPGASVSGWARLCDGADLGANAVVVQSNVVGAGTRVGAGAVVTSDLPPDVTAVGMPARVVRRRSDG